MARRETFSERLELRLPPEIDRLLEIASATAFTTKSEYARQALIARLREHDSDIDGLTAAANERGNLLRRTQGFARIVCGWPF